MKIQTMRFQLTMKNKIGERILRKVTMIFKKYTRIKKVMK